MCLSLYTKGGRTRALLQAEWKIINSSVWDVSSCPCFFFSRLGLNFQESVPPSKLWEMVYVAQTCLHCLGLELTSVAHHQGGAGVKQWLQTSDPTAPCTLMMAEMIEKAGPHGSSIGHATATATSQDTTVGPAVPDGEELPVTKGFSQVSRDINGYTVLHETQIIWAGRTLGNHIIQSSLPRCGNWGLESLSNFFSVQGWGWSREHLWLYFQ